MNAPGVLPARPEAALQPSQHAMLARREPMNAADLQDARDRDLLRRVSRGQEDAFRELFGKYAPTARALALRILRRPFLADETVQEAFLALWRHPQGYERDRGSVRAWLMSTVHHRAVDLVRREEAHRRRTEGALPDPVPEDPAEQAVHAVGVPEERAAVRAALADLPTEQRQVIELLYFEGLTQSQVAERMGLPLGTVKSRVLLAMRRMRAALGAMER
ncbi:MAG TPA: sigma-70 family RNA polymerase sigma factor [Actinomycetota bacterium]|nr:sigma-70 family RNA polymerase sigma factor [Actinomycetota bacterium]